jgi:putative hemolysin
MESVKGFLKTQAMGMAKSAVCKASPSAMKDRLRMALDVLPDEAVASMVKSSSFCQIQGGRRKTRKQKRKQRKTRKH